ncbi:RSVR protein, partial [Chaetorhynchus papuensis]|nr:RSVR protein [Chaetorhynchus papuensis]
PHEFQCAPGAPCFPRDWRCDGHPDCDDDGDEWGCGTATVAEPSPRGPAVTPPRSSAVPPTGSAGTGARGAGSGGPGWVSACALSSPGLLSILVAAGSVAVWGLSKAKRRPDIFSLEKAAREQLMPDQSQ